jgi:hypothetical protein
MRPKALITASAALVVSIAADAVFLGGEGHGEFWWSRIYGFFSLFGFFGCLAIIVFAKLVLGPWLQHEENYYRRRTSL